ncbi:MAG TPA: ChbG/HpnK family deacetylase [Candidatus Absconditabacterales bacterium]|nr:ChbG/HpnK family deacetylase [Candidatus Absconditabacterales bacterium]
MIKVIINADDFGISDKFDEAILELLENKQITSTTVLVRGCKNKQNINRLMELKKKNNVSIGLHFKINGIDDYNAIMNELNKQYNSFKNIFGIEPSHIDKHNRENNKNEVRVMCDFAIEHNLPIRLYTRGKYFKTYEDEYKNKIIMTDKLYNITSNNYGIKVIKEKIQNDHNDEIWEVICHPGFFDNKYEPAKWGTELNKRREKDYEDVIELSKYLKEKNIKTISFLDLK